MFESILTKANLIYMLKAAGLSVEIAVFSVIIGTFIGIISAICKISKNKLLRGLATAYVEIIRGTPMLLQILFFFLGIPTLYRLITGQGVSPNPVSIGIVAMSINSGAYSTELIRSAINAIDKGQWEAGVALGLSKSDVMIKIILPQAFKRIVPPMVNEFVTLIKDSSLISTVGGIELLKSAQVLGARYYNYLVPLLAASVIYLVMTLTISYFANKLERRLSESD